MSCDNSIPVDSIVDQIRDELDKEYIRVDKPEMTDAVLDSAVLNAPSIRGELILDNEAWASLMSRGVIATGPRGPQGAQGKTGAVGQKGATGDRGPMGPQGPMGLMGPQGNQGIAGVPGVAGKDGPQGLQGLKGDKGDPGSVVVDRGNFTLPVAKTDYMHLFSYGQSLSRGVRSTPGISTKQPHQNVTFTSGPLYRLEETHDYSGFKPLIAEINDNNEAETPGVAFANHFVDKRIVSGDTADQWRMVMTAPGLGGTSITELSKGTYLYTGMISQVQSAYAVAQQQNKSYSVWAMAWTQGEADEAEQTPQKTYYDLFVKLKSDFTADVKGITKQDFSPIMLMYQTASNRRYNRDLKIPQAQLELTNDHDDMILATPIYHLKKSTDDLHLVAESSKQLGRYYAKALHYTLYSGSKWQPVKPISIVAQGRIIDITYMVQSGTGLVFDTTLVLAQPNMGFDIWSGLDVVPIISSVTIVEENRIRIVLNQEPTAGYLLCYGRGRPGNAEPKANLRDNAGAEDNYINNAGVKTYMHNWATMFQKVL